MITALPAATPAMTPAALTEATVAELVDQVTGQTPPAGQLIMRNIIQAIPCVGGLIEGIVILTNSERKKLGDNIAKAVVVAV